MPCQCSHRSDKFSFHCFFSSCFSLSIYFSTVFVYFCFYFCFFVKWIFSFGLNSLCIHANAQSWLIRSHENKCECFMGSRDMNIVSNPCSLVCCQYSPNCSLKAAMMVPYFTQWNVSIFSQWIQGWFVWISLISCSHLNYWCSSVRPAFPMTDGLCSQVIFLRCYSSLSSSFFSLPFPTLLKQIFWVAKGFPSPTFHPLTHPFPLPCHLPCVFSPLHPPFSVHPLTFL